MRARDVPRVRSHARKKAGVARARNRVQVRSVVAGE